ncbi:uncharacterized protein DUF3558 [Amycolatopsis echigonensis]|uniref:Uncharacterized protein DUF3558 n=1 Tax=Amycolatopsis echigonensis TaxID=2576905 RepID=A0A2N3WML9_9PSEU|nr:DUF3558 family protein [Amycolatopsis niigatensis]PKV95098.1 uncharacterized protein DUF3558 [Amycolatopsis niigatensis]
MNSPYGGMPQYGQGPQQPQPQWGQPQWGPAAPPPPPAPPRKKKLWLWLVPLIVIVLAATATGAIVLTGGDPLGGASASDSGMQPEAHTPAPQGRDAAAVTAALRAIDPCALVDPAVARQVGNPNAVTIAKGPHACFLVAGANYEPGDPGVTVKVGEYSEQLLRYFGFPTTIAGAKAYQYSETAKHPTCRMEFPVSFELAIEFSYSVTGGDGDVCPVVRRYAEAAVPRLRNPAAIAPAQRPYSAWDGCTLLATALPGDEAKKYRYRVSGSKDPLAGCETYDSSAQKVGPKIEMFYDTPADLTGSQPRSIAGKNVGMTTLGDHCQAKWDAGPAGNQNKWFADVTVQVEDSSCDAAAALAEHVMGLATGQPGQVAPAKEVLYGPGDNDTGARGACIDLAVTGSVPDCEPYQQVTVASSAQQIMADAAINRNVQCAVFNDAIVALYGKQFTPVTWGSHCFFVDPKHELMIQVNVNPKDAPGDYGQGSPGRRETTIAGKAAVEYTDDHNTEYDIYLSPTNDLRAHGNLHIKVEGQPGRGKDMPDAYNTLPPEALSTAEKAMAQTVEKYFK